MKKISGYILLSVLVIMQVYSALGVLALMRAVSILHVNGLHWDRAKSHYIAEQVMQTLEVSVIENEPICLVPIMAPYQLAVKTMYWWEAYGCKLKSKTYVAYYILEHLGVDHCAFLANSTDNQSLVADYYRITLWLAKPQERDNPIVLQSTLAKDLREPISCADSPHDAIRGRQMHREF